MLPAHVVRALDVHARRRPAYDELARPEAHEVREVRVAAAELQELGLALQPIDAGSQPGREGGDVESLPRADRRGLVEYGSHEDASVPPGRCAIVSVVTDRARIAIDDGVAYVAWIDGARVTLRLSGKMRRGIRTGDVPRPVVGDFMSITADGLVEALEPRRSRLARKAAGRSDVEQVIAAAGAAGDPCPWVKPVSARPAPSGNGRSKPGGHTLRSRQRRRRSAQCRAQAVTSWHNRRQHRPTVPTI